MPHTQTSFRPTTEVQKQDDGDTPEFRKLMCEIWKEEWANWLFEGMDRAKT